MIKTFIVAEIERGENTIFGLIPVVDQIMLDNLVICQGVFRDTVRSVFGEYDDVYIDSVVGGSLAYDAILRYGDFDKENFDKCSKLLMESAIPVLIANSKAAAVYELMKEFM